MSSELTDIIKSVFCSYRGILIVYGYGGKVNELSGAFTLEKADRITELSNNDTEFNGRDFYNQFVSEALSEKQKEEDDTIERDIWGSAAPQVSSVSNFTIENTDKKSLQVVLFGAHEHGSSNNFGNANGITIDKPQQYHQFLLQSMTNPVIIKSLVIQNTDKTSGIITIKKKSPTGFTSLNQINLLGEPYGIQQNITQLQNLNLVLDGRTEFNFGLAGNSKINIKLFH